jgi:asparagine synthase (glutamine-hydrolysing)
MCGIYGIVDLEGGAATDWNSLGKMAGVLRHRGPDDEGRYCEDGITFGMRRLSIIDLDGGHQPIPNEDNTVWVVCNGEIYNFRQLRADLETRRHRFRCRSDTEVIVHLYEELGLEFVKKLRGMFGLALWDTRRRRLVIARDPMGEKPLYVRRDAKRLLFASEIKSILAASDVPRQVNFHALGEYLALGYVPAPLTLFQGIEKVLPGHYIVVEKGQILDKEYWDVSFAGEDDCAEEEWVERIRDKFVESVRMRLMSDVPLGAFLSGGIDSSAIVAAMSRVVNQPLKTYSIGFEGEDSYYNELPYARTVAKAFNTDHHEIIVCPEVGALLSKLIWHLDEPMADSAFITTYLVSKLARESVKVILSGVGGDELFGGYRRYLGHNLLPYYKWLPDGVRTKWLPGLLAGLPQDRHSKWENYTRLASAFVESAELPPDLRYESYITLFAPEVRDHLLKNDAATQNSNGDSAYSTLKRYFRRCQSADHLNQIMYVDIKTSLADDLLTLTDKMTMATAVECRAPFVDHELVQLTSRMPSNLKVRGLTMKYLLKKVLRPWLPKEVLQRKKRGFGAPVGAWLRRDLGSLMAETLSEEQVKKRGFFDWHVVHDTIMNHESRRNDYTDHLLALINLELWCRLFLDGGDRRFISDSSCEKVHRA